MVEKLRVERSVDGVRSNVALPDRIFIYLPSIFLPFTLPISLLTIVRVAAFERVRLTLTLAAEAIRPCCSLLTSSRWDIFHHDLKRG